MTQSQINDLLTSAASTSRESLVTTRVLLVRAALPEHRDLVHKVFMEISEHNQASLPDYIAFFAIACGNRQGEFGKELPGLEPGLLEKSGTLSDK